MTPIIFKTLIGCVWAIAYFGIGMNLAKLLIGKNCDRDAIIWTALFWPIALISMLTCGVACLIGKIIDKCTKK